MTKSDESYTRESLEKLLTLRDEKQLSEELMRHGQIQDDEVPILVSRALGHNAAVRRTATRLLGTTGTPKAQAALRQLVTETDDPAVWALALGRLLDAPEAKSLSAAQPKLLDAALHDKDPAVTAVALRAAVMADRPGIRNELARRLGDADAKVREAAVSAIGDLGDTALEAQLRARILVESDSEVYSALVIALCKSADPTTADTLRQVIAKANQYRENDFSNSVLLSNSQRPWLRAFLLDVARQPGKLRWSLFRRLAELPDGAPRRDLMTICITELDKFLPAEPSKKWLYSIDLETCLNFICETTGTTYKWDELFEARDAARQWVAAHPG